MSKIDRVGAKVGVVQEFKELGSFGVHPSTGNGQSLLYPDSSFFLRTKFKGVIEGNKVDPNKDQGGAKQSNTEKCEKQKTKCRDETDTNKKLACTQLQVKICTEK